MLSDCGRSGAFRIPSDRPAFAAVLQLFCPAALLAGLLLLLLLPLQLPGLLSCQPALLPVLLCLLIHCLACFYYLFIAFLTVLQLFCPAALLSELDDFDNLAGWEDLTAHVVDKFAEVVDFYNFAVIAAVLSLQFYSYSALLLCCLSLTTLTTLPYYCSFSIILRCCSAV